MPNFSARNSLRNLSQKPITIRNSAPEEFRLWFVDFVVQIGLCIDQFRTVVCQRTYSAKDPNNWSPNEYMLEEIRQHILNAEWYYVYDVVESVYINISRDKQEEYSSELNTFFESNGYGWKFNDGLVQYRGDEITENIISEALESTSSAPTTNNELKEALKSLSRRPDADVTGAVQHSMAALECFSRQKLGESSSTLGDVIKRHRSELTSPLDIALEKLWGFASNNGRHIQEGSTVEYEDAELTLNVCFSLISYLEKKI